MENRYLKIYVTSLPELLNWAEKCIHALSSLTWLPGDRISAGMLLGSGIVLTHNTMLCFLLESLTIKLTQWRWKAQLFHSLGHQQGHIFYYQWSFFFKTLNIIHQECCSIFETLYLGICSLWWLISGQKISWGEVEELWHSFWSPHIWNSIKLKAVIMWNLLWSFLLKVTGTQLTTPINKMKQKRYLFTLARHG